MSVPIAILHTQSPPAPPDLEPVPWIDQVQAAHAAALVALSTIETQIWNGERGLWIRMLRDQAERRVKSLTAQLAEELARVGVR